MQFEMRARDLDKKVPFSKLEVTHVFIWEHMGDATLWVKINDGEARPIYDYNNRYPFGNDEMVHEVKMIECELPKDIVMK